MKYPLLFSNDQRLGSAEAVTLLLLLLLGTSLTAGPSGAQPASDLTSHPGYIDFSRLPDFDPDDLTIEINLGGSLLGILAGALEEEESEFGELIGKLRSINVRIFELDGSNTLDVRSKTLDISNSLVKQGWEAVVRIRDDQEVIQILVRHDDQRIAGLAAMFVDGEDSAGFINIVGEVDPGQVARIGRQLNIGALEALDEALKDPKPKGDGQ